MKTEILTFLIFYPVPYTLFYPFIPYMYGVRLAYSNNFSPACDMASNSDVRLISHVQASTAPPLQPGRIGIYDMRDRLWVTISTPCSNQSYLSVQWFFAVHRRFQSDLPAKVLLSARWVYSL